MALIVGGTEVTSTAAELNIMDGVTSTAAELNEIDGFTGDLTGAFTLGSASQFKEVAKGTGSWAHAAYTTIHSAGATEDSMWMSILTSSDGAAYGVIWFHSANGGDTHNQQQPITNLASAGQWSGDNLQISQSSGGTLTVNWVLYQLTKD